MSASATLPASSRPRTEWLIAGCDPSDGAALARNNMSAFWEDSTWRLVWPKDQDITLDFLIVQTTKRIPRNLIKDCVTLRHQKAVDPATGKLVGYARWVLPPAFVSAGDGTPNWPEAQIAEPTPAERERIEKLAETAWWGPRHDVDVLDDKNHKLKLQFLAEKPYLVLDYIAVHPENKGRGIATALVESGMRAAEKMGVDMFIQAFKAAYGVYTRLGFKERARNIEDDSKYGGEGEYANYFLTYDVNKLVQ